MNTIVWSAVIAAVAASAAVLAAIAGGSHNLVLALGLGGVVAALLNLQK